MSSQRYDIKPAPYGGAPLRFARGRLVSHQERLQRTGSIPGRSTNQRWGCTSAVGGVTGGIPSAVGYIATTKMLGQEINFKSLAIATGAGVVAGALTPIITLTAPVTKAIVPATLVMYGTVATTQYIIDQKVNNKPVDTVSAVANFGVGSFTGIIGGVYSPFDEIGREGMSQGLKLGMDFGKQALFQREKIAAQEFINYQVKNGLSNLARTFTTSLFQTLAPRMWEHKIVIAQ